MYLKAVSQPETNLPEIKGLRMTKNRQAVYSVLVSSTDHPTASDVHDRARKIIPDMSLATVYNSLETLVEFSAARQVNFDRESSRYCANLQEHGHFYDSDTGKVQDVVFKPGINLSDFIELPEGAVIDHMDISIRGSFQKKQSN